MLSMIPWFSKKNTPDAKSQGLMPSEWMSHLTTGDVTIDCGANVGKITLQLAKTGATVHAFEPNPHAFAKLKEATAPYRNVTCYQKAVGTHNSKVKLYMHENASEDPLHWSTGSSMLESKGNINPEDFIEVDCIDLCDFIRKMDRRIMLLKMDVEGVECQILKAMIKSNLIYEIERVYCEMHDKKIESLKGPAQEIRDLVSQKNLHHVNLDWI